MPRAHSVAEKPARTAISICFIVGNVAFAAEARAVEAVPAEGFGLEGVGNGAQFPVEDVLVAFRAGEADSVEFSGEDEGEGEHGIGAGNRAVGFDVGREVDVDRLFG
jgi:hypothetical protein